MCENDEILHRTLVVASNVFMIFPIWNCFRMGWRNFLFELFVYSMTMIVSSFYHMCDALDDCTRFCIIPWKILYSLDFIFSYQIIPTLLVFTVDPAWSVYKGFFITLTLFANIIFVVYIQDHYGDTLYFIGLILVCVIMTVIRLGYLLYTKQLGNQFKRHFDWIDGVAALTCGIIGLVCKIFSMTEGWYWLIHSGWHIFIMLSVYFAMQIYDTSVSLCCWFHVTAGNEFHLDEIRKNGFGFLRNESVVNNNNVPPHVDLELASDSG
jgi:hypothetical protein